MKKILITGGSGFFASRFAQQHRHIYDILPLKRSDLDVTDETGVLKKIQEFAPDYIMHTAANAVTDFCNKNPEIAHQINVEGSVYVAKAARKIGAKLLFISSEQIFNGNQNTGPFAEEDVPEPNTVYGQNKKEAEGLLREIMDDVWIIRFTWLFGMPQRGCGMSGNIFWDTLQAIMKNEKVSASPHEFRGMTYVHEMVEQIVKIFHAPYGTYHLGAENSKSRYEIVKEIFSGMGLEHRAAELLVEDETKYMEKNRDVRLNTRKAAHLGMAFSDTSTAIQKCIADYSLRLK